MVVQPHARPFTVEEYYRMDEAGIIGRGDRVEVRRDPSPDGHRLVRVFGRGQQIAPTFAPDLAIETDATLGEAAHEPR